MLTVEALDEAVLLRFAGRDAVPSDAGLIRPAQDGVRGPLGPVVADNRVSGPSSPASRLQRWSRSPGMPAAHSSRRPDGDTALRRVARRAAPLFFRQIVQR